jgi:hypothetical protein
MRQLAAAAKGHSATSSEFEWLVTNKVWVKRKPLCDFRRHFFDGHSWTMVGSSRIPSTDRTFPPVAGWLTFFTSWCFLVPAAYAWTRHCPRLVFGCLSCLLTSVANHFFSNLVHVAGGTKPPWLRAVQWFDRAVTHFCILYFVCTTVHLDMYWAVVAACIGFVGFAFYVKLQFLTGTSAPQTAQPALWHASIHGIANVGIGMCIASCADNKGCSCCNH